MFLLVVAFAVLSLNVTASGMHTVVKERTNTDTGASREYDSEGRN
jgi:hypothetical protein